MADDILKFLGVNDPDIDGHQHREITEFLGLPADVLKDIPRDPYGLGPPEARFTPEYGRNAPAPGRSLQAFREAIDPGTVLPAVARDIGGNIAESAVSSARMAAGGMEDILANRGATGVGKAALGTLGVGLSPVTGAVRSGENLLRDITGQPEFASKAALMVPLNVGGPAVRTAAHNIHPTTRAADEIAKIVGPENMPNMLERLTSNPRLRPIDIDDQLRMAGQGFIASPGSPAASRTLTESMRSSAAGARDAVKGTYNEAMGPPPNLFEEKLRLENRAKAIGRAQIAPPLIASKPVDVSPVLADIDKALNPAAVKMTPGTTIQASPLQQRLLEFRQKIASGDKEMLTDADRLHDIQSALRREADDLLSSATKSEHKLGRELMDYRNKLVDQIDAAAPGYKKGLAAYKDQMDIERAFEFGKKSLSTAEDYDPSFIKAWVDKKGRSKEELDAARLGQRYAIEKKMGSIKQSALDPARSGTDVPQIEFNKLNIQHLHGKENTEKMFKHLQDERDIALTNARGLGNSKTAETQAYQKRYEPREISTPSSNLPGWALALGAGTGALTTNPTLGALVGGGLIGARGVKSGYDWLARRGEVSRNRAMAELLTSNTPETRALLSIASQRVSQRNKLKNLVVPP